MAIADQEPESFIAGDTVQWKRTFSDYKATDGWALSYALRGAGSINLTGAASGSDHLITISAATSATYAAGTYAWSAYVQKAGERYTVGEGYLTVKANLATALSVVDRLIQLEADIAAINGFLGKNYKYSSYSIAGRSLANYGMADLFMLRDRLSRELGSLRDAEKIKKGVQTNRLIRVRFNA